jgi:hypothetical protein
MKRVTRCLTGLFAAASLVAGLGVGAAQAQETSTATTKTVMPGMRITFSDSPAVDLGWCTLGAVGTDSAGRKVGITAGHCNPSDGPAVQSHTQTNDDTTAVWDWRDQSAGPIGWIRWVSVDENGPGGDQYPIGKLDYMVIEFAPNVTLSSQLMRAPKFGLTADGKVDRSNVLVPAQPLHKINAIYSDIAGAVQIPPKDSTLCNIGSTTNQDYVQAGSAFNMQCGPIVSNPVGSVQVSMGTAGVMMTDAGIKGGDSGGPAFAQNRPNEWAGIGSWVYYAPLFHPFKMYNAYTSAKNILADLNPRGITGSGFQITNN